MIFKKKIGEINILLKNLQDQKSFILGFYKLFKNKKNSKQFSKDYRL